VAAYERRAYTPLVREESPGTRLVLPVGTQVVVRPRHPSRETEVPAGAVGVIVHAPGDATHRYRVRLPDGREVSLPREDLAIRKHDALPLPGAADADDLYEHVIYRCVIGSQAYGLADGASDVDRRGIYLPPAERHWSLAGVPEQLECHDRQECYWELQKFLTLALKANPTVLECLFTPLVELAGPLAEELRAERGRFLSRLLFQTYNGYVLSQFKKLEQDLRTRGEIRWKHAMHLIRLLLAGVAALREGELPVRVSGDARERLLAVKRGERPWAEVDAWRLALHVEFEAAFAATRLPERPDYAWADAFLIRARRSRAATGE
jgi:uncharacterized protein